VKLNALDWVVVAAVVVVVVLISMRFFSPVDDSDDS
jgi:hypothetical protein